METPFCKIVVSDQVDPGTIILASPLSPQEVHGVISNWNDLVKQWLAVPGKFCVLVNVGEPESNYNSQAHCYFCGWEGKKSEMIKVPDQISPSQPPKKTMGYRCPKCGKLFLYDGV